eukprot:321402_1
MQHLRSTDKLTKSERHCYCTFNRFVAIIVISTAFFVIYALTNAQDSFYTIIKSNLSENQYNITGITSNKSAISTTHKILIPTPNPTHDTISDLNNDLFCPTKKNGFTKLLKHIHQLQLSPNCNDNNRKFYILEQQCNVGFFASLECIVYYFAQAIFLNRTFLIKGDWSFADHKPNSDIYCQQNGMDCYFMPLSVCNVKDVLEYENNKSDSLKSIWHLTPKNGKEKADRLNIKFDAWDSSPPNVPKIGLDDMRVLYVPGVWGYHRIETNRFFDKMLQQYYGYHLDRRKFDAVVESYLLRMKPFMTHIINDIVFHSLYGKNTGNIEYDVRKSVSILIRWGDKCRNKELYKMKYPHAEMECFTYHEYMKLIQKLKIMKPDIKYVIVTCDTKEIIDNITNEYKPWMDKNGMQFIVNIADVMQGSSVIDQYVTTRNKTSILISLLSTLRMHFASKYYFIQQGSFWNTGTFTLIKHLKCLPFKSEYVNEKLTLVNLNDVDKIQILLMGGVGKRIVKLPIDLQTAAEKYKLDFSNMT